MPTAPPTLATKVSGAIASMIKSNNSTWPRGTKLADDLGLTELQRRGLADRFTAIARNHTGSAAVSRQAAGALATLQEAIDLVAKAAGFDVPTP